MVALIFIDKYKVQIAWLVNFNFVNSNRYHQLFLFWHDNWLPCHDYLRDIRALSLQQIQHSGIRMHKFGQLVLECAQYSLTLTPKSKFLFGKYIHYRIPSRAMLLPFLVLSSDSSQTCPRCVLLEAPIHILRDCAWQHGLQIVGTWNTLQFT